jgi:hypothetical protein
MTSVLRARAIGETRGFMKAVLDGRSDRMAVDHREAIARQEAPCSIAQSLHSRSDLKPSWECALAIREGGVAA